MKLLVLLALVCLATAGADHPEGDHEGGGHNGHHNPEAQACFKALLPHSERDKLHATYDACIAEHGLKDLLDSINAGDRHHKCPADQLEEHGYTAEALELRKCVAYGLGFVAEDGTFKVDKFKAAIEKKVEGTPQEENIELGLEKCPTDELAEFEVREFIHCLVAYCVDGSDTTPYSG